MAVGVPALRAVTVFILLKMGERLDVVLIFVIPALEMLRQEDCSGITVGCVGISEIKKMEAGRGRDGDSAAFGG